MAIDNDDADDDHSGGQMTPPQGERGGQGN